MKEATDIWNERIEISPFWWWFSAKNLGNTKLWSVTM